MVPIQHLKLYLGRHSSCARLIENCEPSTYVGIGCPSDTNGAKRAGPDFGRVAGHSAFHAVENAVTEVRRFRRGKNR